MNTKGEMRHWYEYILLNSFLLYAIEDFPLSHGPGLTLVSCCMFVFERDEFVSGFFLLIREAFNLCRNEKFQQFKLIGMIFLLLLTKFMLILV